MSKGLSGVDLSKRAFINGLFNGSALATLATLIGPAFSGGNVLAAIAAGQRRPSPSSDIAVINGAIQLEQKAINTYKAAAQADLLKKPEYLDVAVDFAADHGEHRDELTKAVRVNFKSTPVLIENLGTFPVPETIIKGKEADVLRYALMLEMYASKAYLEAVSGKLATDEARGLVASILPVETQHVAVLRTVLMVVMKDKGLPDDKQLVPYAFFNEQPTPEIPTA
ncbi:MAG: ferritin-like domain-containing protein [Acidobacteriota bacterium]